MSAPRGSILHPDGCSGFPPPSSYMSSGKRNSIVQSSCHNESRRGAVRHSHFQGDGQLVGTARHGSVPCAHPSIAPLSTSTPIQASNAQAQLLFQGDHRSARSSEWMQTAIQLLSMCGRQDEANAHIDDPSRAAFLGALTSAPATYVSKDNAFDVPPPDEWLAIPEVIRQLFCNCNQAQCICTSTAPCGILRDLGRVWVIDGSKLYLWKVPSSDSGETLDVVVLDETIESVTYVPLRRSLLPQILRSSFVFVEGYDDPCVVDIFSSNATSTPPCVTIEDMALHCLVVSTTSCVRVYAIAHKETRVQPTGTKREGNGLEVRCVSSEVCGIECQSASPLPPESLCLSLVGMAKKPRSGLKLHVACAHKGMGCVFFGDSAEGLIYALKFSPTPDCANTSQIISKRIRSDFGDAQRNAECNGGWLQGSVQPTPGEHGDIANSLKCKLVPLNESISGWIFGSMSRVVRSLRKDSHTPQDGVTSKGILQIEADESRGIVWALSAESDITAFVLPTPVVDPQNTLYVPLDVRSIKALKLTRREIEGRLSRLVPDWTRSPREEGGLLGLLAGGGPLKGVRLCPTAPHEARVIVAVLVDSLGGRTYLGMSSLFAARQSPNAIDRGVGWSNLRLSVRGYRRPILHRESKLGPLQTALVTSGSFLTAHRACHSKCEAAGSVNSVVKRRCSLCRNACLLNGSCSLRTATVTSMCSVSGSADGLGGLAEPSAAADGGKNPPDTCYCCSVRNVTDADPLETIPLDFGNEIEARNGDGSGDLLFIAAPDLQYLSRSSMSPHAPYCSPQNRIVSPSLLDGTNGFQPYQISSSGVETTAGLGGILENSAVTGPAVEWYSCVPLRSAGRVLMVADSLIQKFIAVPLQSSDVRPSPFDIRKRNQLYYLPYSLDSQHGGLYGSSSRPEVYTRTPLPPCALPPIAVGGLRASPKVLVLTTRFIIPVRVCSIAQIFVKAVETLTANASDANGVIQEQQRQQQLVLRQQHMASNNSLPPASIRPWLQPGFAPSRGGTILEGQAQWQSLLMLTQMMLSDQHFTRDQMFAAFWQLLVERWADRNSLPFSLTGGNTRAQEVDGGDAFVQGPMGANPTLLGRQLGALRSSKGLYIPPAGTGMFGGGGQFQTPFGMGYVERTRQHHTGARRSQASVHPSEEVTGSGVAFQQDTDAYGGAFTLAWYFLTDLTAREESGFSGFGSVDFGGTSFVGSLPQQRITQQQQQQKAQSDIQYSWNVIQAKSKPLQASNASQDIAPFHQIGSNGTQGFTVTPTVKGLLLYVSRLLRPVLNIPLVEAALVVAGLCRAGDLPSSDRTNVDSDAARKRRREFDLHDVETDNGERQLVAGIVGRLSGEAVRKIRLNLVCLYEVLDAVYSTLFSNIAHNTSFRSAQKPTWIRAKGLPPHLQAQRVAPRCLDEITSAQLQSETNQQELVWNAMEANEQQEFFVLFGISQVLIAANEVLMAYELLLHQASYCSSSGRSWFVKPSHFDRLLNLDLSTICSDSGAREDFRTIIFECVSVRHPSLIAMCRGALFTREELDAQIHLLKLKCLINEGKDQQDPVSPSDIAAFVERHLMPKLLHFSIEGLVALLDDSNIPELVVRVITAKAEELRTRHSLCHGLRRLPNGWQTAYDVSEEQHDLREELIANCYRHMGDCLSKYFLRYRGNGLPDWSDIKVEASGIAGRNAGSHADADTKVEVVAPEQVESRERAMALVLASLATKDESLHEYIFEWIVTTGRKFFPSSLMQLESPVAERWIQQNHAAYALDLGEHYSASGMHAQAVKCHSLHGLRPWNDAHTETSDGKMQTTALHKGDRMREAVADIAELLSYDSAVDPVCCPITEPVWQGLSLWAQQHIQSPTLDERLASFVKAKESAQQCIWQALQQTKARFMHSSRNFVSSLTSFPESGKFNDVAGGGRGDATEPATWYSDYKSGASSSNGTSSLDNPQRRSLKIINRHIKMVGFQQALVRDVARVFCVLAVEWCTKLMRTRALATGNAPSPSTRLTPEDIKGVCPLLFAESQQLGTASGDSSAIDKGVFDVLKDMILVLQRAVYKPAELLSILEMHANDNRLRCHLMGHFPSLVTLRLCGLRAAAPQDSTWSRDEKHYVAALEEACVAYLVFAETAGATLDQPTILNKALEELLALPDTAVKECCSRSLKRICAVLHIHANKQWGDEEVVMVNADGIQTAIPSFMWPSWRLAECKQPFKSLINLYLSISQDEQFMTKTSLQSKDINDIFCWLFSEWIMSENMPFSCNTYVGLVHDLKERQQLPYFDSPANNLLLSQLNQDERIQAIAASEKLNNMIQSIEDSMSWVCKHVPNLEREQTFGGLGTRIALIRQEVVQYRNALYSSALYNERVLDST